jgi:hypothetical protein
MCISLQINGVGPVGPMGMNQWIWSNKFDSMNCKKQDRKAKNREE